MISPNQRDRVDISTYIEINLKCKTTVLIDLKMQGNGTEFEAELLTFKTSRNQHTYYNINIYMYN